MSVSSNSLPPMRRAIEELRRMAEYSPPMAAIYRFVTEELDLHTLGISNPRVALLEWRVEQEIPPNLIPGGIISADLHFDGEIRVEARLGQYFSAALQGAPRVEDFTVFDHGRPLGNSYLFRRRRENQSLPRGSTTTGLANWPYVPRGRYKPEPSFPPMWAYTRASQAHITPRDEYSAVFLDDSEHDSTQQMTLGNPEEALRAVADGLKGIIDEMKNEASPQEAPSQPIEEAKPPGSYRLARRLQRRKL